MAKGQFEVSLSNPALSGSIEAQVYEVGGAAPTTIIDFQQAWGVKIEWELCGSLVPFICGEWCINLFFESMGKGPEFKEHYSKKVPLDPCGNGKYCVDFPVPPGTIHKDCCGVPYKVIAGITYETDCCHKPGPMAGYVELPMLYFYESPTI